jgi:hypothetical protein
LLPPTHPSRLPRALAQQQIRANRLAYERNRVVGSSTAAAPLRSTKALTIPQSPHLRLQDRHGEKHVSCRGGGGDSEDEGGEGGPGGVQLFQKPKPAAPAKLTIPVAPRLHTDGRAAVRGRAPSPRGAGGEEGGEAFGHGHGYGHGHSQNKGPAGGLALREYLAPGAQQHPPQAKPPSPRGLTVPQSPQLSTRQRAAARRPLLQGQEAAAAAEQAVQFKAKPVDPRVLHSNGEMGVPKVRKGVGRGGESRCW